MPEAMVSAMRKHGPRSAPVKRRPARRVPLAVQGLQTTSTSGYRCQASGGVACVPFRETRSVNLPRSSTVAFAFLSGGEPSAFRGQAYAPAYATHTYVADRLTCRL